MEKKIVKTYSGANNTYVSFPLGGLGSGMVCLSGTGMLNSESIRNDPAMFFEPLVFAALSVENGKTMILEGQIPDYKIYKANGTVNRLDNGAFGLYWKTYGLPRFKNCSFHSEFPFGYVDLSDDAVPLDVEICGWSSFIPGDEDNSGLPCAALEYKFRNKSKELVKAQFTYNSYNFLDIDTKTGIAMQGVKRITKTKSGYVYEFDPDDKVNYTYAAFSVMTDEACEPVVDCRYHRDAWFDTLTFLWKKICARKFVDEDPYQDARDAGPGASLAMNLEIPAEGEKTVRIYISWYAPESKVYYNNRTFYPDVRNPEGRYYKPYYSVLFKDIFDVARYWKTNYDLLYEKTRKFTDCFYSSTIDNDILEAVAANLSILKSPTILREQDGRMWTYEGGYDLFGCCEGSCTHVWMYNQAVAHLFPRMERSLHQAEYNEALDEEGFMSYRCHLPFTKQARIPLSDKAVIFSDYDAADGQLGSIVRMYREYMISGDAEWLKGYYPMIKRSLDYCIRTWDPKREGILTEPHFNTYDVKFWGPDGMTGTIYLAALKAFCKISEVLGVECAEYAELCEKGKEYIESKLFNGEYFNQIIMDKELQIDVQKELYDITPADALEIIKEEGPKYQYGNGCLSNGVMGDWFRIVMGLKDPIVDEEKIKSHLLSVYKYNFKKDLSYHSNPQRSGYALGNEGGLLNCTWPRGDRLTFPFIYSDEVWCGIEYLVASQLAYYGYFDECLEIVRTLRKRYDGTRRNPYDEYECGHFYARSMASYALLQTITGIRYDAAEKTLYVEPKIGGDFNCFISTASGYGQAGVKEGKPFMNVAEGKVEIKNIVFEPYMK